MLFYTFRSFSLTLLLLAAHQEDETVTKRRRADEQDRPVDILTIDRERSTSPAPIIDDTFDAYDEFVELHPDGDDDEGFYPPPEILIGDYEGEPEPPEQDFLSFRREANGGAAAAAAAAVAAYAVPVAAPEPEFSREISEELGVGGEGEYASTSFSGRRRRAPRR